MPGKMSNKDQAAADEEEFNKGIILPPLIIQLKKILDQYPDDTQILKELIQNAEDAGAKEVRFLFDKNTYGQDSRLLHHPELATFQGPALYAYNDGIFSEEDWKGVRMLSQSVKQKDPFKIGYFGMGFKSVFHLTDLPSMLSGDKLGIIDPHQQIFSASSHCWNIGKRSDLLSSLPHQLEPYLGTFGCDASSFRSGFYRGTLFRFPLRQKSSSLSNILYSNEKVQHLLQNFEHDAHLLLIFVKNLEKISIFDREKHSKSARLLFRAEISAECLDEVRRERNEFYNQVRSGEGQEKPVVASYQMTVMTETWANKAVEKKTFRFLVTNYFCGGNVSPVFRNLFKDPDLGFLPWVGTAMRLDIKDGSDIYRLNEDDGRIFTFLPLPSEQHSSTGLPVHVHGFFALEQNRKYIKWPGSNRFPDIHMDKGLLWNQCMLREALPKCYVTMVMEAIRLHSTTGNLTVQSVYRAFPDLTKIERKWEAVLSLVYVEILKYPVVFHGAEDIKEWIEPKQAIFNTLDPTEESTSVIVEVLSVSSVKIVNIPDHVLQAIRKYCHFSLGQITPTIVAGACKDVQSKTNLHWENKMKLLRYFLRQSKYELLDGLQLLPLANGGFDIFHYNPKKADRTIYIAPSEEMQSLLPGLKDDFLESDIDEDIKIMLTKAAVRGYTQLRVLDAGLVGKLLPRCLPQKWLNKPRVEWNPREYAHPPENWLESLWLFLVRSSPRDLNSVNGLPILPARTIQKMSANKKEQESVTELVTLSVTNVCLVRTMDGVSLSPEVEEVVQAIGIPVINELPDYVRSHPVITKLYVYAPTYMGVLKALERRCAAEGKDAVIRRTLQMTSPQQKRSLRALFSKVSLYEIQRDCLEMLSQLPLFETVDGSGGSESQFISVTKTNVASPPDKIPFPVSRLLIDTTTSDSQVLGKLLGVKQLNMAQLLTQIVFPDVEQAFYDNAEVQRIMLYVLKHYHFFLDIDKGFRKTLKSLAFLPKADMLLTPDRFYDPDNELLQRLFLFEENFPGPSYSEPAIINVLRDVGLRGVEDVEPEDLHQCAFTIQQLYTGNQTGAPVEKLVEKANALLEYLHRHKSRLKADCSGTTLAASLLNVSWVRASIGRPSNYSQQLGWFQETSGRIFYKPLEITTKQHISLVGSVMPIVAADVYAEVAQALNWNQSPPLEKIVRHLSNVITAYNSSDKVFFMEMARNIFTELVKHDIASVAQLTSELLPAEWAWHGDGFTRPQNIVTIEPFMDLRPFVYGLPAEMTPFTEFLEHFGVKHSCNIMEVLGLFKKKYGEVEIAASGDVFQRSVSKTVKRSPSFNESEVKRDLHIYICILNELKDHVNDDDFVDAIEHVYLPINSERQNTIRLAPLSECTYTDDEALRQGYSTSDLSTLLDEKITLVHSNVPSSTCEALGVPTLMSKMLEAEELDYSFGQSDSLTSRLNTLLQEYADGFAIPKELIQNADDAGATEVKFLYDERTNTDAMTCLIDEGMKECQGPALWVYNNAVFTDEDFENIVKLNGATKEHQTDKIGRFGLGFNAVYNITDVPSFVSRHNIVIFDPHTTHLGKSIRNKLKPGLKLDMRRHRRRLRSLGNQFKPFKDIFGCDILNQETYRATLFRLPLRTKVQAMQSEVCPKHYDDSEVKELLRIMVRGAENLLLFTQNVTNIAIYHLGRSSSAPASDMTEIFTIEKRPIRIIRELGPPFFELSEPVKSLNEEMQKFVRQCQILKTSSEIMKQLRKGGSSNRIRFPDSSMLLCIEGKLSGKGEELLSISKQHKLQSWLTCYYMGRGESLKMALKDDSLVPAAGLAVTVRYIPESKTYRVCPVVDPTDETIPHGSVFSHLPLPVRSGLPVHVNGSFSVAANRRYLCEEDQDDKYDPRAIWNATLMKDAVTSAYLRMLNDLTLLSTPRDYVFSQLWPNPVNVTPVCSALIESFYQALNDPANQALAMFSDGRKFGSMVQTIFLDCGYDGADLVKASLAVGLQVMGDGSGSNRLVVSLPSWVQKAMHRYDAQGVLNSRTYDEAQFFSKVFLPNIDTIQSEERDLLMLNALSRNSEAVNKLIIDHRCIPVTPDGSKLSSPSKLIDPTSFIARLFLPVDERFPYRDDMYSRSDVIHVLRGLGMKQSARDLDWSEILERAEMLRTVSDQHKAEDLSAVFLEILNEKLTENTTGVGLRQFQQRLLELPLIPAMKKPRHFPLHWKGNEDQKAYLLKPSELYPPESKDLIGCVQFVVDETVLPKNSEDLLNFLRLGIEWKEPTVSQVLAQLDLITNPTTENYLRDHEALSSIQKTCYDILAFFQERCTNDSQCRSLKDALENRYFILAHNRFLSPKQLAFNFSYNCAPYLYELPEYYKHNFSHLLKVVGVKESFAIKDFVFALQSLHDIFQEEPLDKESLKVALLLVNLLNEMMAELGQTTQEVVNEFGPIYIPDARNVLTSATELCFNEPDTQWVPKVASDCSGFSHPLISYTVSKQLGVNTKRQEVLNKHSRGIPFGQKEPLTNRIKRILSGYPCDKEILKELLQNADDAGATEVCFIIDPRQHNADRVFDQSWRPLQGPALCVYNNKPFTDSDLHGIQSLGHGSKSSDPNKTGQYGVGFNCVYHLTDAPSFLTRGRDIGETLCVFDPNARYVPGATIQEPGRRYDDVSQLRKIFTDVFPCYLEDKFPLDNGTMFRFPLRDEGMAKESELSDQVVTVQTLKNLFEKFKQEVFDCLLFLNSVKIITLTEVDSRTNKLIGSYTVRMDICDDDLEARSDFSSYLKTVAHRMQTEKLKVTDIGVRELSYTVDISDSSKYSERWIIAQRIGVDHDVKLQPSVNDAVKSGEVALLPRGGVAAFLSAEDSVSIRRPSKAFCFLPLPVKTELPVHINGHFCLDHEARRNLWQDDDVGTKTEWNNMLLRHVIAPAYVSLLRRAPAQLSSSMIDGNVSLMDCMGDDIPDLETYCSLFPRLTKQTAPGYWRILMESIYKRIDEYQEIVLPVVRSTCDQLSMSISSTSLRNQTEVEWHSTGTDRVSKPYFDDLKDAYHENEDHKTPTVPTSPSSRKRRSRSGMKKPSHEVLRHVLLASGFRLVRIPMHIYESFIEAGVDVGCVSPRAVIDFYASYKSKSTICLLSNLPEDISETPLKDEATLKVVLEYCSRDIPYFRGNLNGLPLLLCEDGKLKQFSNREKVYMSRHSKLCSNLGSMFILHTLAGSVFKDADIESCDVFKRFDVKAFAGILGDILPAEFQITSGLGRIQWIQRDSESIPNERWIAMVWTFLNNEFERMVEQQPSVSETHLAKSVLQPLRDWCLLPALAFKPTMKSQRPSMSSPRTWSAPFEERAEEHYLVAIRMADSVVDYSQASIMSTPLRHCLGRLGILELDIELLERDTAEKGPGKMSNGSNELRLAHSVVSTPEQPQAMIAVLDHAVGRPGQGRQPSLSNEECYTILKYFSDSVDSWADDGGMKKAVRHLPLHLTIHDSIESLSNNEVFVLEDDLPKTEMDVIQQKAAVVFLRSNQALARFYSVLDCSPINATEVYLSYIFGNFDHLSANGRLVHLQFLKDYKLSQLRGEEKNIFLTGLSKLRFLPEPDGRLRQASEFMDPSHPVFKVIYKNDPRAFPPQPFCDYGWLDFLRQMGLQKDLSVELLVKFAKQIAESGRNDPTDETYIQSRTLISHLFKLKNLPTIEVLEQLVDIPFVPSCKTSPMSQKISNAFGASTSYIAFKNGISEEHEVLLWTSMCLLPDWANPYQLTEHDVCFDYPQADPLNDLDCYRREIGRILRVDESPSVELVIEHLQNICSLPINKADDSLELRNYIKMSVMNRIYKFLQQKLLESGTGSEFHKVLLRLADIPCIVSDLGQAFVKPKQVVINLYEEDQIYPYLYQAPTELGEFKKLFLHLGATLHATAEQYASVLEGIYYETGREKLHPNEMRLAFKAVNGLFTTLQKHRHKDALVHVHNLFLPTKTGHLFRSTEIIFNDEPSYADRIDNLRRPFLVDLAECRISAANYDDVVRLLPHRLRPAMLSAVVREYMEDKSMDSVMMHTTADKLKYQINSRPFAQGLVRLIKNEHRHSGHKVRQTVLDNIEQNLKKIHVYGVDRVVTFLAFEDQRIHGSESECECFIEKKIDEDTGAEMWSIYVNKSSCLNEELQVSVAEGINKVSGGLLKHSIHYIQPILSCLPHSIPKVLDRLKVRPEQPHGGADAAQSTLPVPGTFIPTEDHHLLKEDFEEFETGEYVGFELDDDESGMPTVIYAVILEMIVEEDFNQSRKISESDQFAHRKLTQKYRINVGDERPPSIASATDLYKFHRIEGIAPRISISEPYSPGMGPKKSPKSPKAKRYRESFYSRSSVFESDDGLPGSGRPSTSSTKWDNAFGSSRGPSQSAFSEDNLFADSSTRKRRSFNRETEKVKDTDGFVNRRRGTEKSDAFRCQDDFQTEEDSRYNASAFRNSRTSASQPDIRGNAEPLFQEHKGQSGIGVMSQQEEAFDQPDVEEETVTTEKVMEEVSDTLEEAWKLPEAQRKKIIKRILLKWHPDKNIGNEAFSTVITQHIQAELERLELGLPRPTHFDPSQFDFDPRNPFAGSSSFQQNFANAYKFFFDQMNQRAKEHKQQRERYQENYREYSANGDYYGVPPTFSSANPQPAQAKRFLRQAQEDLRAADNDYEADDPAYEWVCFKAHQSAEKALKAAQFAVDAVTSFSHDLVTLAASLEDVELRRLAQKLQKIVGNSNKLYNPDPIDFVIIPHEEYTKELACDAVMCAVDILERVKEFVELRDYS